MSAITTGGNLVHYEVLGRGRPVILVHGWIGSWRYWIPTMQVLQIKYRVYALDLYGFGDSAKNPQRYSIEHQIALLDDFMQQLGIPKAAMIGHGLGALIVAEFARRYPDRVPRMLVASAPLFDPGDLERRVPAGRKVFPQMRPSSLPGAGNNGTERADGHERQRCDARRADRGGTVAQRRAAARAGKSDAHTDPVQVPNHNPLLALMESTAPRRCWRNAFGENEPSYEKLGVDLAKIDPVVLQKSVESFNSGRMLDTLRLLTVPMLVIHGVDDPLIPQPSEEILNYITLDKENLLLPILLPERAPLPDAGR